jgi:hypothetical protein
MVHCIEPRRIGEVNGNFTTIHKRGHQRARYNTHLYSV